MMAARNTVLFSLLLLLLVASVYGATEGGKSKVKDVEKDKEVQDLGRFSVEEFNRRGDGNGPLIFSRVVEAEKQVVSGIKYYLRIEATQNGETKVFDSVVVVKPWLQQKELLNFSPE